MTRTVWYPHTHEATEVRNRIETGWSQANVYSGADQDEIEN